MTDHLGRSGASPGSLHVEIQTDGRAKNSQAFFRCRGEETIIPAARIVQASASVRTERASGIRIITATIWEQL